MNPDRNPARLAGALYLLVAVTAPFALIYVPSTLIVRGDAAATAQNILNSEMLFRISIVVNLISTTAFVLVVATLYRLLKRVNAVQASIMVILALIVVPISFVNIVHQLAALTLVRGADYLLVFDKGQREALAMLFLGLRNPGVVVAQIFWGLWLFPFGLLVIRSGFLPRVLGVLLLANGFAYVAVSLTALLLPGYLTIVSRVTIPFEFGEIWIMVWLLVKGPKIPWTANLSQEHQ